MMNYNFDERIDRRHTDCLKYEMMRTATGRDDLLPLWVADMDFRTPPFVTAAVERRLRQGILGYPYCPEAYAASVCHWLGRRHGLRVEPEAVHYVPGVVPGLAYAVAAFTEKNGRSAHSAARVPSVSPGGPRFGKAAGRVAVAPDVSGPL